MSFYDDARLCDQVCYDLRLADYPRAQNRVRVQELANGWPPFTDQEAQEMNLAVNVNDLSMTRLLHDARMQFYNAFMKPGNYFTTQTDAGPVHKRQNWGAIRTKEINRVMKKSTRYFEAQRSKFGMLVLHGISPRIWIDQDGWCPKPVPIEDALVPSNTLVGFDNLPYFVIYHQWSAIELRQMTQGPSVDPGWNMDLVEKCLVWLDHQATVLMHQTWPEIWAPEKVSERVKGDTGFYASDQIPTINAFSIYAYDDSKGKTGWVRRVILDSWSQPANDSGNLEMRRNDNFKDEGGDTLSPNKPNDFLYTSGDRVVANTWREISGFHYADLSAVAPFRYHSVRSLGFLLYAVCDLQNRLRCRFNESLFEHLLQYFRVRNSDDAQRVLNLNLINRGFIDPNVDFVKREERWSIDRNLVELGLGQNNELIQANASSFTPNTNLSGDRTEKTKFQVMAELNASTSLISSALNQAYQYQQFEYDEVSRRFCRANSSDMDVKKVRSRCLARGIPEKYLNDPECWDNEPERVMGGGNKTMEMAIARQLMEWRMAFDPEPQRTILRDAVLSITDDPARATDLVPEKPVAVTDSVHDAQLASAALMQGLPVGVKTGINHVEYIAAMVLGLEQLITQFMQQGGMAPPDKLSGMQNMSGHAKAHLEILAQDPQQRSLVKAFGDRLGKLDNELKAFAQRLSEAMKRQGESAGAHGGGVDPKDQAKIQATIAEAQAKQELTRESHAQRTAQRQLQFEQQMRQQAAKHQAEMAALDLKTAGEIRRKHLDDVSQEETEVPTENPT